jgi:dihydroflavonol-4-reductase
MMGNRRSLETGGGGFIGSHLVRQLLENDETVRVLELPDVPLPDNVEVVRGSICDADVVCKALKGVQRLYHLAANPNLWAQKKVTLIAQTLKALVLFLRRQQSKILKL